MINAYMDSVSWVDTKDPDIAGFVASYPRQVSFDLQEKLTSWSRYGFVIFERVVEHELIDKFQSDIQLIRERHHDFLISLEIKGKQTWTKAVHREAMDGSGVKFNHLHVSSLFAAQISLTREVTEFLEAIFDAEAVPTQSLTFWRGSEQPTHIDYPYVRQQKRLARVAASWVPLEDVHFDAGPLAYYPGAHRPEICGFFDWGNGDILCRPETRTKSGLEFASYLDQRLTVSGIKPQVFLPRKGDVLIWHGNMPHTGTPIKNSSLTRKSYVTHYTGLLDYPDAWLPSDMRTSSIRLNRGVVVDFPWSKPDSKLPSWTQHFSINEAAGV